MNVKGFLIATTLLLCSVYAEADDSLSDATSQDQKHTKSSEISIEVGALIFIGLDFRVFYRQIDSPWVFGIRYLNIEDDFVNESLVGAPEDSSDKLQTQTYGIYFDYLFNKQANTGSFYLTGALFKTTQTLKCYSESDSDSAVAPYFGGGWRGSLGEHFGYDIGLLLSPFAKLETATSACSNESSGAFDIDLGLIVKF